MSKNILIRFGREVKKQRIKRRLSQVELAKLTGLNRCYIGIIENGNKAATIVTMAKLAKAFRIEIRDFFP